MIYVIKTGRAWTVVGEDSLPVVHRRVRAVHRTREAALDAAQRYSALRGEVVSHVEERVDDETRHGPEPPHLSR